MSETFWNGEPTGCRRVDVIVAESPPAWWCADLVGTRRRAVLVEYPTGPYLLDNEDGSGWAKVTEGQGSPSWPHRSLPPDSEVIE